MSHREPEQSKITVTTLKNSSTYVQRKINATLRITTVIDHAYIEDVVVSSRFLKEDVALSHLAWPYRSKNPFSATPL